MIVAMSRVLAVGPKRLLTPVLETLQGIGSLHVDRVEAEETPEAFAAPAPDAASRAEGETLERLRARADGLLALLPSVPEEPARPTEEWAARSPDELESALASFEGEIQPLTRRRLEIQDELELIRSYEGAVRVLSPLLGALAGSATFETVGFILRSGDLSIVQQFRRQLEDLTGGGVEVVSRTIEEGKIGVVVAFRKKDAEAVRGFLARAGVSELRLPSAYADLPSAEAITRMERRSSDLPAELERVRADLQAAARRARPMLVAIRAALTDRLIRLQVVPRLAQSRYTFVVHGWTPTRTVEGIRRTLARRFDKEVVVYDTPADPHEAERVPVLLDNPGPIKPFQMLLGLFPPPRYGTWDPSPLMAVTFPIFVGLVIGDAGYGALFFLLGWWLRGKARAGQSWTVPVLGGTLDPRGLLGLSWVIRVLAFWIIVFGVLYAEVFGNLPELLFHVEPIFNRVHEPGTTLYFKLIILFGIVMVYLGLVAHLIMAVGHRHLEGIFESLVLILASAALLIFLGTQAEMLPAFMSGWSLYLLGGSVVVALSYGIVSRRMRNSAASLMWFLESFTAFGHILSHARLMAFGLAAAALGIAANELGLMAARSGGILGIILAVLMAGFWQGLFLLFTIIGHVIQPARLHWVEFLTKVKYHDEIGREYQPFQRAGGG
ncbi:MAG TPA: V-type ATPase 116kDa subunit family protein [bacterium]|nr:V-type ATPase 116kDa subunit family protein [bacterium]